MREEITRINGVALPRTFAQMFAEVPTVSIVSTRPFLGIPYIQIRSLKTLICCHFFMNNSQNSIQCNFVLRSINSCPLFQTISRHFCRRRRPLFSYFLPIIDCRHDRRGESPLHSPWATLSQTCLKGGNKNESMGGLFIFRKQKQTNKTQRELYNKKKNDGFHSCLIKLRHTSDIPTAFILHFHFKKKRKLFCWHIRNRWSELFNKSTDVISF